MGIAKFDDGILDNVKFETPGAAACWLWFCSVLACRRGLSDGFISSGKVKTVVPGGLPNVQKHVDHLVAARLWEITDGGYRVHDYLDWNPSKVQIEDFRESDKIRKQEARVRKVSTTDTVRIPSGVQSVSDTRAGGKSKSTSEKKSEDQDLGEESLREGADDPPTGGVPPKWGKGKPSRIGLVPNHPGCSPLAAGACERGWCVPVFLIAREWLPQVRHERPAVARFVNDVLDACPAGPIGDDPIAFWRAMWKEAHGTRIRAAGASRTADTVDAGKEYLRRRFEELIAEGGTPHVGRALES